MTRFNRFTAAVLAVALVLFIPAKFPHSIASFCGDGASCMSDVTEKRTSSALWNFCMPARAEGEGDYIKWVDFDVSYKAMAKAMEYDVGSYESDIHLDWIELLSYLGTKYGGDFSKYKEKDMADLAEKLVSGGDIDELTADMKHYAYYHESYRAVLGGFIGNYSVQVPGENDEPVWENRYGLKAFLPIAADFGYSHFDDFGAGRSYGYARRHLGHDMFGAIGTPIIAVESGVVEAMGWNQYGGWRLGIRSFDGLRYYYYAHLRQNRPYHEGLKEGDTVKAGDVIGYMGHTGYSAKENVNNINQTHLHYGLQLIFDPSQKDGTGEIWIDLYAITRLLQSNRSKTYRVDETKEFYRQYDFDEPSLHPMSVS